MDQRPAGTHSPSRADPLWLIPFGLAGAALFAIGLTSLALSVLTIGLPLVIVTTAWCRWFTDRHRRWAGRVLGTPITSPYRRLDGTTLARRVITIVRDPATWRDLVWLLVNAIVGVTVATLSITLLLAGLMYLIYPFLWSVTPPNVFGVNFGIFRVHDLATSCYVLPLGVLSLVLWWFGSRGLLLVNAKLARALLGPSQSSIQVTCSVSERDTADRFVDDAGR